MIEMSRLVTNMRTIPPETRTFVQVEERRFLTYKTDTLSAVNDCNIE